MNELPFLHADTHVPLPAPTIPPEAPAVADRNAVLTAMSDTVPTEGVDIESLDPSADQPVDGEVPPLENIQTEGADPYEAQVRRIANDQEITPLERVVRLEELSLTNRDLQRPEQQARMSLLALEEENASDIRAARRASVVGQEIIRANTMREIIDSTKASLDAQFDSGGFVNNAERTTEFIASELLPTGWIKSGHFDPAALIQAVVPEIDVSALDHVVLGDTLLEARQIFGQLEPEEQVRRARDVERVINRIQGTFNTDNKFEADRLHTVFAGIVGDLKEYDEARMVTFIEPIINVATLGIGSKIVKLAKGVVKNNPLKIAAEVAPESSDQLVRTASGDASGETAQAMGTSRAEILEDYTVFNDRGEPILRGPDIVIEDPEVTKVVEEITRIRSQHNLVSDDEIKVATEALENKVKASDNVHISKSAIYRDEVDNTLRADYTLTPDDAPEFSTFREASDFVADKLERHQLDKVQILKYDAGAQEYLPATVRSVDEEGGFVIQAEYRSNLANAAIKENVLNSDAPTWFADNLDTTVVFNQRVANAITGIELSQAQTTDILTKVIRPFKEAGRKRQLDVEQVLKEGNEEGIEFADDVLYQRFAGDRKSIEAYKSVRRVYDINHALRNIELRNHLQTRGFQQIKISKDQTSYLKRTVDEERPASAYDPKTGKTVKVDKGTEVYTAFNPIKYTDETGKPAAATHIVTSQRNLSPLSAQVLPKIPGYIGTHLDAKWVVKSRKTGSNGIDVVDVVKFGNNPAALRKWISEQDDQDGLDLFFTRETDTGEFSVAGEAELMLDLEVLGHAKHRSDLHLLNDSYKKNLLTPEVAVAKDITAMARQSGLKETAQYLISKWNVTYGHLVKDGQMPWGRLERPSGLDTQGKNEFAQAQRLHKRIQLISGMDDDTLSRKLRNSLLYTADKLAAMSVDIRKKDPSSRVNKIAASMTDRLSLVADTLNDFDVVAKVKNLNYLQFIVFHPVRQLALQAATSTLYLGVDGGTKYAASGRWGADTAFLATAKAAGINDELFKSVIKTYAKGRGIPEDEARKMFKEFDESGLLQSISSHQFLEYANESVVGKKLSFGTIKRAAESGFRGGESANLISAYTVIRNRQANKLGREVFTEQEARDIAIEAKQLAGNMGTSNKAAFQQGLLGVPFQFMSHNVKMLQLMAPNVKFLNKVSMPTVSNREKAKIGASYALMWGSGGLAVSNLIEEAAVDAGIEIDPDTMEVIEEGMAGWAIESAFETLAGDEGNFDVSETFGALNGIAGEFNLGDGNSSTPIGFVAEFVHETWMNQTPPLHELMGASGRLIENHGTVGRAVALWQNPVFDTGEKFVVQAQYLAEVFPVIDEAMAARAAYRTGQWVNSQGDPIMEAAFSETLAKGLFGIEPSEKEAIYNLQTQMEGRSTITKKPEGRELRNAGKTQAQVILAATTALNGGRFSKEQYFDRLRAYQAAAKQAYPDPVHYAIFMGSMRKEIDTRLKAQGTTIQKEIIENLMTDKELQGETSYNTMMKDLRKLPPSPQRDWAIENMDSWFGAGRNTGSPLDRRQ